jgi:hypothetical protein
MVQKNYFTKNLKSNTFKIFTYFLSKHICNGIAAAHINPLLRFLLKKGNHFGLTKILLTTFSSLIA